MQPPKRATSPTAFRSNRLRPAYAWNCDLHSLDTRRAFGAAFLEIDAVRTNHEQRASIRAAECAGDYGTWKLHPFADLAALVQAQQFVSHRRGQPDGALGVECATVRHHALVELRPYALVGERAIGLNVEGSHLVAHGLADDKGFAIGSDDATIGTLQTGRGYAGAAVGLDENDFGVLGGRVRQDVVAEITDVSVPLAIDHHVVAMERCEFEDVGVHLEAVGIEPEQLAIRHRNNQQPAVGQPAEA